jgi:effector-binding domain-containing protein
MKALKTILILLLLLVVLAVIAMLVLPKQMQMTRTMEINAPVAVVWNNVSSLRAQDAWSPWNDKDPNMTKEFTGVDGEVGSKSSWKGNEDVGEGYQELVAIDAEAMETKSKLVFTAPWEAEADITMKVEATETGSKMSWSFDQNLGMPTNLFMTLMNMKKQLSNDFDKGLGLLKEAAEKQATEAAAKPAYEVQTIERPSRMYLVKKETVKWSDMNQEFFAERIGAVYGAAMASGAIDTTAPVSALYFTWDTTNQQTEMSAAIAMLENKKVEGFTIHTTTGGTCLSVDHYGSYDKTGDAHMALEAYMNANNLEMNGAALEEYVTDPEKEKDPSKVLTRIVYPVKNKEVASDQ